MRYEMNEENTQNHGRGTRHHGHDHHGHPRRGRHHEPRSGEDHPRQGRFQGGHFDRDSAVDGFFSAGRHGFGDGPRGGGGRHGFGHGQRGGGDENGMRAGRMLAQSDLRLVALSLIAEAPRHGYELIKLIEDMTQGWYTPSPGVIYPMLTYLDDAGFVTVAADGNKRLFTITEAGSQYLSDNRVLAEAIIARLKGVGERAKHAFRPDEGRGGDDRSPRDMNEPGLPRSVEAAVLNLREVAARKLKKDEDSATEIVNALLELAFRWSKD